MFTIKIPAFLENIHPKHYLTFHYLLIKTLTENHVLCTATNYCKNLLMPYTL